MSALRRNLQLGAVAVGLLLLLMSAVGVALGSWRLAALPLLPFLALVLGLVAHAHQRVGDTMRQVIRSEKAAARARRAAPVERPASRDDAAPRLDEDRLRDSLSRAVAGAVERDLVVSRGQLIARMDAIEGALRSVGGDLHEVAGLLDERARVIADEMERHSDGLDESWAQQFSRLEAALDSAREDASASLGLLRHLRHEPISEIDAMLQLHRRFPLDGPVPLMWGWALSPRALLQVVELALEPGRELVVECGSGTSTIFLGRALRDRGHGRLVALEHLPDVAEDVRAQVARHGLEDVVEVRDAALEPVQVGGESFPWYDVAVLDDLHGVDLLLVDGPPAATGPRARYPAVPVLGPRLAPGGVVALDDANRPEEREVLRQWLVDDVRLRRRRSLTANLALLALPAEEPASDRTEAEEVAH